MIENWRLPTPFFISSKPEFLGVKGVTGFVGILMAVGSFDTQSFHHKIRNAAPSTFPWKGIWKVKVPKRVAFFMWTVAYSQILTLDNLMIRGRPLANRCCLCCCNAESVDVYASVV